eukprot:237154-Rhodomonas_salina.4
MEGLLLLPGFQGLEQSRSGTGAAGPVQRGSEAVPRIATGVQSVQGTPTLLHTRCALSWY